MCDFFHNRKLQPSKSPWGENDQIGRLNLITDASRNAILSSLDYSKSYNLSVDYFIGMPSWAGAGDPAYQIWMTHTPQGNVNDQLLGASKDAKQLIGYSGDAISMYTHCGTHIDTLNHFGYGDKIWNEFDTGSDLGSRHWNVCGAEQFPYIAARAVLIDVAGYKGVDILEDSYGISAEDLEQTLASQGSTLQPGDIALVRTGRMRVWPDRDKYLNDSPGLNLSGAEYLAEKGVIIVGSDNIALEQTPSAEAGNYFPVHTYLLCEMGMPIIEVLWLEELAKNRVYEMGLLASAMPLRGATGAPLQPVAFKIK
ncbi:MULTISPECIES: cyclase family protein [Pseudomonas]|uniref:Kynurenine formamidase n=1 Tax=Pseudomonas putida TaxID=303 RepID=A0A1B2F6E7_PSEPU|nr:MULTISPECIES: cyclase family protein [Pseudomonas]ANY87787.1 Kynurenine formamidase [Pseudomonas putida]MCL8304775.1 cyclase family protein [Pseudomonas putida]